MRSFQSDRYVVESGTGTSAVEEVTAGEVAVDCDEAGNEEGVDGVPEVDKGAAAAVTVGAVVSAVDASVCVVEAKGTEKEDIEPLAVDANDALASNA